MKANGHHRGNGNGKHAATLERVRCAIYTRKSIDRGLDQAFNSLDAQRESCAAYITAQTHDMRAMLWTPGSLILIFITLWSLVAAIA